MADNLTISKHSPGFPEYLDFRVLRAIGLQHIQALSSQVWTDYNLHDPGVTILEVLCYALTDLGYRNNLDIRDLLALNLADTDARETNFFTADAILTCNPVSELDWRKRLIDIPGVRNAWLKKVETVQPEIYINCTDSQLQFEPPENQPQALQLHPRGLYDLYLDLEQAYHQDAASRETVLQAVKAVLCSYRNLCEDFREIQVLGLEEIGLCTDIELLPAADPEDVLVEIYVRVQAFLAPRLRFYTLQELLAQGKNPADIFAGRPSALSDAAYESHGFIDSEELEALRLPEAIYTSDLYQIMMDVPGVAAIKKLSLINYIDGQPQSQGHPWYLKLTDKHRPVLGIAQSTVTFFKGDLPFKADAEEVQRRYNEQQAAYIKAPREPQELDLPVPQGSYADLADYYSIHHEFPLTYGVGEEGLPATASAQRQAQAKQLKGYLIFFDQLLANYLAQLAHIRDLFSWESEAARQERRRTYFTQILTNVPGVEEILHNYGSVLNAISEDTVTYGERRNRFLDHLLARFAETFSDYVMLNYRLQGGRRDEVQIIDDKARFLQEYPTLSRDRFRAFNYCDCEQIWDTENVSGFQRRVARLLGMANVRRRSLSPYDIIHSSGGFTPVLGSGTGEPQLIGRIPYPTLDQAEAALEAWVAASLQPARYQRLVYRYFYHYGWEIVSSEGDAIATYDQVFPSQAERSALLEDLVAALQNRLGDSPPPELVQLEQDGNGRFQFRLSIPLETGDILGFTGVETYATETEARQAAQDSLRLIQSEDRYRPMQIRRDDAAERAAATPEIFTYYGYGLGDEAGTLLAAGTVQFLSSAEREVALQRWLSNLRVHPNRFSVEQATACFWFELRNGEQILLRAIQGLPGEAEVRAALAQGREAYRLTEEAGAFGFFLTLPGAQPLAEHPPTYETTLERDLRLEGLLYALRRPDPLADIAGEADTYRATLLDRDETPLLITVNNYATPIEAEAAYQQLLQLASDPALFQRVDGLEGERPYGFVLANRLGETFAVHPGTYSTTSQRDLMIQSILNYLNTDVVLRLTPREGQVYYELVNQDGALMLVGVSSYADETAAEAAFEQILPLAQTLANYRLIDDGETSCPYSFALYDGDTLLAQHPRWYETAERRDQMLEALIYSLINDELWYRIDGTEGQLTYALVDVLAAAETALPLLVSAISYPDEAAARTAFNQMLIDGADPSRYRLLDSLPEPTPYSFELQDETGAVIARHQTAAGEAIGYATAAERQAAIDKIVSYLVQAELPLTLINPEGAFFAEVYDEQGTLIWIGQQVFPEESGAAAAAEQIAQLAAAPTSYRSTGTGTCAYGFELVDEAENGIARYPRFFASAQVRDQHMQQLQQLAQDFTFRQHIAGTPCGYSFLLDLPEIAGVSPDRLHSLNRYPSEAHAWEAAGDFAEHLCYLDRYLSPTSDPAYGFGITDGEDVLLAATASVYDPLALFQALNALEPLLQIESEPGDPTGYRFVLLDRDGIPLLRGTQIGPDEETVRQQFYRDVLGSLFTGETLERLDMPGSHSFRILAAGDGGTAVLAIHPHPERPQQLRCYDSAEAREAAIAHLLQTIQTARLTLEVQPQLPAYTGRLYDQERRTLVQGTRRHTYEWAYLGSAGPDGESRQTWLADGDAWQTLKAALTSTITNNQLQTQVIPAGESARNSPLYRFQLVSGDTVWFMSSEQFLSQSEAAQRGDVARQQLSAEYDQWGDDWIDESAVRSEESTRRLWRLQRYYNGRESTLILLDLDRRTQAQEAAWKYGNALVALAQDSDNFRRIEADAGGCTVTWELTNKGKDQVLGMPAKQYASDADREAAIQSIQDRINDEGFHLLEHILLLPRSTPPPAPPDQPADVPEPVPPNLLPITVTKEDCTSSEGPCQADYDPYSFWISMILPYWPERFQDMNFRRFVERTLRLEAPAHIVLKICWIDVRQMYDLEQAYAAWLQTFMQSACAGTTDSPTVPLTDSLNRLIDILSQLTNVYPEGTLHDCEESGPDDNPIILNQTALGTANQ
jgi:hypothetical protein